MGAVKTPSHRITVAKRPDQKICQFVLQFCLANVNTKGTKSQILFFILLTRQNGGAIIRAT